MRILSGFLVFMGYGIIQGKLEKREIRSLSF